MPKDYRFISNNSHWFDAISAAEFLIDGGEGMYFTADEHFVHFVPVTPEGEPESYTAVQAEVGVCWMQANNFAASITAKMKALVKGSEY